MVTSDFRQEVNPTIIIGTVRSFWNCRWGRYHVPQNVFLVLDEFNSFLSVAATTPHDFVITGDFNIHLI